MVNIFGYIPETILLITTLICSLFLVRKPINNRTIKIMNTIFILGIVSCTAVIVQETIAQQQLLIKSIFKIYFLLAATYHLFTYTKKFHTLERLCLLATCTSLFVVVSTTDTFVIFAALTLCIVSTYGFALTRERPSKDTAILTSLLIIISVLYGQHPFMASIVLLFSTILLYLRTTNKDLEAFGVILLIPANIYILLRELLTTTSILQTESSLITIGFILMLIPPVLLFAGSNKEKTMAKFATFYIGTIIFLMGSGTLDIKAAAVFMALSLVFFYSPTANPLTIIGLTMLPPTAAFVVKLSLFWAPFKNAEITQVILISAVTLAMSIFAAKELYRFHISNKGKLIPLPIPFRIISIAVIIVSVIYFSHINQTLEYAIRALGK